MAEKECETTALETHDVQLRTENFGRSFVVRDVSQMNVTFGISV